MDSRTFSLPLAPKSGEKGNPSGSSGSSAIQVIRIENHANSASLALTSLQSLEPWMQKQQEQQQQEQQPPLHLPSLESSQKTVLMDVVAASAGMRRQKVVKQQKERKVRERVKQWDFEQDAEECERQHAIFMESCETWGVGVGVSVGVGGEVVALSSCKAAEQEMHRQIRDKIHGYRYQDQQKGFYDAAMFVTMEDVVQLLRASALKCYYCRRPVLLLYRYVRDGQQWSLERLDNGKGHNRTNVVVACLQCNLHRKTANSDSFVFSKQLSVVVKNTK